MHFMILNPFFFVTFCYLFFFFLLLFSGNLNSLALKSFTNNRSMKYERFTFTQSRSVYFLKEFVLFISSKIIFFVFLWEIGLCKEYDVFRMKESIELNVPNWWEVDFILRERTMSTKSNEKQMCAELTILFPRSKWLFHCSVVSFLLRLHFEAFLSIFIHISTQCSVFGAHIPYGILNWIFQYWMKENFVVFLNEQKSKKFQRIWNHNEII